MAEAATQNTPQSSSRYISEYADIIYALKQLRDQRCTLSLSFDKDTPPYQAKMLDVHDDHFLIEDITPRDGNARLKAGERFTIAARGRGLFAFFNETSIHLAEEERGLPYFLIPIPDSLLIQQRRRDARYRIPVTISTKRSVIALHRDPTREPFMGNILDVSAGGCRAEFAAGTLLQNEDAFKNCTLTISDVMELTSEAVIRHTSTDKGSHNLICGIELTKMDVTNRRRLEHFIQIISKGNNHA